MLGLRLGGGLFLGLSFSAGLGLFFLISLLLVFFIGLRLGLLFVGRLCRLCEAKGFLFLRRCRLYKLVARVFSGLGLCRRELVVFLVGPLVFLRVDLQSEWK